MCDNHTLVHRPDGSSPDTGWHGPYVVAQHPDTGRYHVLDQSGRDTSPDSNGYPTPAAADDARDAVDRSRSAHTDTAPNCTTPDPAGHRARVPESASELLSYYAADLISFDEDDDPYVLITDDSGWRAIDYGGDLLRIRHAADPGQDVALLTIGGGVPACYGSPGTKPATWDQTQAHATLTRWITEHAAAFEAAVPGLGSYHRRQH